MNTRQRLDVIDTNLNRIANAVETLAAPLPIRQENHFHGELPQGAEHHAEQLFERPAGTPEREGGPWREVGHLTGDRDAKVFVADVAKPEVTHPLARVAVLAVSLNLKNRLDALRVFEGTDVLDVIDRYAEVQQLRDLLGPVTESETKLAIELYDALAS